MPNTTEKKILIVDDEALNIEMLKGALNKEYKIYATTNGRSALDIANKIRVDLILLDILMPGMDGYSVLKRLKEGSLTNEIPVIFLTSLDDITDKTRGFKLGAVDYITKPFDISELKMRISTHIELRRSKTEIQNLLTKTLGGSIEMLLEIISVSNPPLFSLSAKIKVLTSQLAHKLKLEEMWKFELAGMLSHIGCFPLSDDALVDVLSGRSSNKHDLEIFRTHPELGSKLISKIPRLKSVSQILARQSEDLGEEPLESDDITGAQLIKIVSYYIEEQYKGRSNSQIIEFMKQSHKSFKLKYVLELEKLLKGTKTQESKHIPVTSLQIGMILSKPIYTKENKVILETNTLLNNAIIEHLKLLARAGQIDSLVNVIVKGV